VLADKEPNIEIEWFELENSRKLQNLKKMTLEMKNLDLEKQKVEIGFGQTCSQPATLKLVDYFQDNSMVSQKMSDDILFQ
jgi:hypothetical protein